MPKEPRAGEFEQLVLLAILHLEENAYGMTIQREIENRTERRTALGAVYTTLDRLERKGYISSWTGAPTPARGGRSKRLFKVQTLGKAALRNSASIRAAMASGLKPQSLAGFPAGSPPRSPGPRVKRSTSKPRRIVD
jgi:PadR family transcriptional regulator, regulatory protein PadR